jgi:hypothetical protein
VRKTAAPADRWEEGHLVTASQAIFGKSELPVNGDKGMVERRGQSGIICGQRGQQV